MVSSRLWVFLKPFHKVRVLTQLCVHRKEEEKPQFFPVSCFLASLRSKFSVIQAFNCLSKSRHFL